MRIQRVELFELEIPFRFSFRHALADRKCGNIILLRLVAEDGTLGWGEIVPRAYLTGESISSAWEDILSLWWPALRDTDFSTDYAAFSAQLHEFYLQADAARKTASYAGVDLALHDLAAKINGKSLVEFIGGKAKKVRLSAPLGGGKGKKTALKAILFRALGFTDFKVKTGLGHDRETLSLVRRYIGADKDLRVDSNGGWSIDQALAAADTLRAFSVSSVEQPVDNIEDLARFRKESGLRVMADESLCTLADARALIDMGAADLWNVRLAKVGGFTGMRAMIKLAGANNIALHLGSLVGETSLLQAAGRAASTLTDFTHVEYAFPRLFLKPDPFRGGPAGYFGVGSAQVSNPGLGVYLSSPSLGKTCKRKLTLD